MTKRQSIPKLHEQKMNLFLRQKEKLLEEKETYKVKMNQIDKKIRDVDTIIDSLEKKYNRVLQAEAEIEKVFDSYYEFMDSIQNTNRKTKKIKPNEESGNAATLQPNTVQDSIEILPELED